MKAKKIEWKGYEAYIGDVLVGLISLRKDHKWSAVIMSGFGMERSVICSTGQEAEIKVQELFDNFVKEIGEVQ